MKKSLISNKIRKEKKKNIGNDALYKGFTIGVNSTFCCDCDMSRNHANLISLIVYFAISSNVITLLSWVSKKNFFFLLFFEFLVYFV